MLFINHIVSICINSLKSATKKSQTVKFEAFLLLKIYNNTLTTTFLTGLASA
jgi:hypothetical protein